MWHYWGLIQVEYGTKPCGICSFSSLCAQWSVFRQGVVHALGGITCNDGDTGMAACTIYLEGSN